VSDGEVSERGTPHVPGIDLSTTYGFRTSEMVADSMDALLEGDFEAPNSVFRDRHGFDNRRTHGYLRPPG
jgi:hypothetical protein